MLPDESIGELPKWDYQEYPKTLPRGDFWGQVRRTVMGKRISEEQVTFLVDHVSERLALESADILLDLGCGNGALSARLFGFCAGFTGVEVSAYLVDVAKEFFERSPTHVFVNDDVTHFVTRVEKPDEFTKCLSYALFQYLAPDTVDRVLQALYDRFPRLNRLVVGSLPNREKASVFFKEGYKKENLDEPLSQIGRWWSKAEFASLASRIGWSVSTPEMPPQVFNAAYRFDVVLTKS